MAETPESRDRSDRSLFDELVELDGAERMAALDRLVGDDAARRERLLRLLDADRAAAGETGFLSRAFLAAVGEAGAEASPFGPLPRPLGPFRLLSVLGTGGMGVVFEAEQQRPRRRVALKVMRSDLASRSAIQRFRREIETLGRLQHPGIAQIHEAGSLAGRDGVGDALPYIAMELVRGQPLDDFIRASAGSTRLVAELIARVCDAVHHAHQRGVVHRDLKPANILVVQEENAPAQPKVLDFGIARLAEREGPGGTIATIAGQILGTLAYMSPEQLLGESASVDHRSDVYALGVMLYELLAGRLPLDVRDRPIADAARIVRDEEPTRLGTIDMRLRGDLETIVSKAIEKDPARRYPSAQALGDELRRHLRDEPILARPITRVERIRRFARRNRAVVVGTAATMVALLGGTVTTAVFASRAIDARDRAEWTAYRANIAAASGAFAARDVASARRFLGEAPRRFRGWEWRYLDANLDRSLSATVLAGPRLPARNAMLSTTSAWLIAAGSVDPPPAELGLTGVDLEPPSADAVLLDVQFAPARTLWRIGERDILVRDPSRTIRVDLERPPDEVAIRAIAYAGQLAPDGEAFAVIIGVGGPVQSRAVYHRLDGSLRASIDATNAGRHIALAVGPNDLVALGGSPSREPIIWHPRDGSTRALRGHLSDVNAVAFSPDGTLVATGGSDRSIRLHRARDASLVASVREHLDQVTCLDFSADGAFLASGSVDRTLRVWSVPSLTASMVLSGHEESLQALSFHSEMPWILSYDGKQTFRRWSSDPAAAFGEHRVDESNWGRVFFSHERPYLFSMSNVSTIRRWDLSTATSDGRSTSEIVDSGGRRMHDRLAASYDGMSVAVLDVEGIPHLFRRTEHGWSGEVHATHRAQDVTFAPDGRCMLVLPPDLAASRPLLERGVDARTRLRSLSDGSAPELPIPPLRGAITSSSDDGRWLTILDVVNNERFLAIVDATTGRVIHCLPIGFGAGHSFGRLPDGRLVLAIAEVAENEPSDQVMDITIRSIPDGAIVTRLSAHTGHVLTVAFSPDATRLASGGRDRLVRLWDTTNWQEVASFGGPTSFVWSLAFSPDGGVLVSSGGDRIYRFWRITASR
jgi:eukaryotic-like serine/threonine-protein kinase